jgi:hypothetical protein
MSITKAMIKAWEALVNGFVISLSLLALCGAWSLLNMISPVPFPLTMEYMTGLLFALGLALMWTPLAWLIMNRLTPCTLTDLYLKEPHFTASEIIGMSVVSPLIPFPTTMFMVACTLPRPWLASRWLRRRQMSDLRDHAPRWFVWCSRIIWSGAIVHSLLWFGLLIGLGVYLYFFDV